MKKLIFLLSALLVMCFTSGTGYADPGDIINIKFGGSPAYNNGAAINDVTGQTWNSFASTDIEQIDAETLMYSNGVNSGATIYYNMTGTKGLDSTGTAFTSIDKPFMRGFISTDAYNTGTLTISGLSAGTYTVYVYSQVDKNLTSTLDMTANGTNFDLTNNGSLTALTLNQNWTSHDVIVGSDGLLNVSFGTNNQINGLQLVEVVPEPGSLALIGVGSLFALGFKRLKSKEESAVA